MDSSGHGDRPGRVGKLRLLCPPSQLFRRSPATAAWSEDTEPIARIDLDGALAGESLAGAVADQPVFADGTGFATLESPRLEASAFAHERDRGGCEELDLSFDSLTTRVAAATTRPRTQPIGDDPKRVVGLE